MDEGVQAANRAMQDHARPFRQGVLSESTDESDTAMLNEWLSHRHFVEVDSTQSYVEREHKSFDQSRLTVVSADFQTAGRGTRERTWHADRGMSALMTFFFRFPQECDNAFVNRNAPNVTQVVAVSAVDVLRETVLDLDDVSFGIKWPNDIVANGMKLGGILARAEPSPGPRLDAIIVGIGVNMNTPQVVLDTIERPVWPATSLRALAGDRDETTFDVEAFRSRLALKFAANLRRFFVDGFAAFRERVNASEVHIGRTVLFRVSQAETFEGTYLGVDENGHILLALEGAEVKAFPAGEIVPRPPALGADSAKED